MFGLQRVSGGPSREDITGVKACVRRADHDWQGNALNPISGRIKYEKESTGKGVQKRATTSSRFCEGYEGSPMCPEGQECVGIYLGGNGVYKEVGASTCFLPFLSNGKCQAGDIVLDSKGFYCPGSIVTASASFPKCGICEAPKASGCQGEVKEAFVEDFKYPSTATSMAPSGAFVTARTTVRNEEENEQSTTVSLQFTTSSTNTVSITDALATNIHASLKIPIPLPLVSPDGTISAGKIETFTNAEAKAVASTLQVTNAQVVKILPKTMQTIIGTVNTQNVRLTIPVTIRVRYTCGKEDEIIESTADMTSDGMLLQGTRSFEVSYGPSETLP